MCCFPGRKASCLAGLPVIPARHSCVPVQRHAAALQPPPPLAAGCEIKVSPKWRVGVQIL